MKDWAGYIDAPLSKGKRSIAMAGPCVAFECPKNLFNPYLRWETCIFSTRFYWKW